MHSKSNSHSKPSKKDQVSSGSEYQLSRRNFLQLSAAAGLGITITACAPVALTPSGAESAGEQAFTSATGTIDSDLAKVGFTAHRIPGDAVERLLAADPVPVPIDFRMLAAACDNSTLFDELGWPVASMDLRGQTIRGGQVISDDLSAFEPKMYMSDFEKVLDTLKVKQTSVFGYSHGGYFATAYALTNPERVSSLILVEPALFNDAEELQRRAEAAMNSQPIESLEAMVSFVAPQIESEARKTVAEDISKDYQSNTALAGEFLARANNPISPENLASLQMPVLLIGGQASDVKFMVEKSAELIPHAQVAWIEGANHFDLMSKEYVGAMSEVIREFLA
jgi:pimeloyl-ACP methyl ester carboxylesterase